MVIKLNQTLHSLNQQDAHCQHMAQAGQALAQMDQHNGRLMREDVKLARFLALWAKFDDTSRDELIRLAELAMRAPGGIG